ncbi:hypothetical protein ACI6Q2_16070 [Chitinophagaceae bacterium LWZ2-11]
MKKIKNYLLAAGLMALNFMFNTACSKSNSTPAPTVTSVTANVDGSPVSMSNIATAIKKGPNSKPYLEVKGDIGSTGYMALDFFIHEIGTNVTIDVTKSPWADFALQNATKYYESSYTNTGSTGTIAITKNDTIAKLITGTFSGQPLTLPDTSSRKGTVITNGVFTVNY